MQVAMRNLESRRPYQGIYHSFSSFLADSFTPTNLPRVSDSWAPITSRRSDLGRATPCFLHSHNKIAGESHCALTAPPSILVSTKLCESSVGVGRNLESNVSRMTVALHSHIHEHELLVFMKHSFGYELLHLVQRSENSLLEERKAC